MDRILKAILGSERAGDHLRDAAGRAGRQRRHLHHPGRRRGGHGAARPPSVRGSRSSAAAARTCRTPSPTRSTTRTRRSIKDLARDHGRNAEWAEPRCARRPASRPAEAVAMEPPVVDILAADVPTSSRRSTSGARADGRAFTFNGRAAAASSPDWRSATGHEHRPAVPAPAVGPERRLHPVHDRLLRNRQRALPPELLIGGRWARSRSCWPSSAPTACRSTSGGLLLILLGIGLFVLELHVTSYGLLTVGGVVCIVLGAFALWTGVDPEEDAIRVSISPWLLVVRHRPVAGLRLRHGARLLVHAPPAGHPAPDPGAGRRRRRGADPHRSEGHRLRGRRGMVGPQPARRSQPGSAVRVVGVEGLELIVEPGARRRPTRSDPAGDVQDDAEP